MQDNTYNLPANFYSGTSGLVLPVPNKQAYPPEYQNSSRLTFYGSLFNSIEINSSFYRLPMASTVKKWANEVPDAFRFTYKLLRDVTHNKELLFESDDVSRFLQVVDAAGDKKGSLLIQFPGKTDIGSVKQLEKLLVNIGDSDWDIAVEFRNKSWYHEDVYRLLDEYQAAIVTQDMPKAMTPMIDSPVDFVYLRFHGPNGGYRGSYSEVFLQEYAQLIAEWLGDGKKVYCYFNNTAGEAVHNLITLNSMVAEAVG
ncbi:MULTISPECIES: DUF72 domain-containing protein [unclassified Mucilaginibacter]|uniref:DUF72 domain-containing protein n=1 Tax=unclassified Mucilaginibacter TaxID=2617802 RepID=UPI00096A050A|nr:MULTISPECIES: DUF72 domain-containing protein [unclassified Mucilaginibacter]OJW15182.1 MAG: hypothetical protein BGO48_13675 [Mucilaginibacter sp. 44-25]PLW88235.1 MAG: DUF72 domain-containing protein [Mucilaginibacter sp.]PMP66448.1 MAG: DUF72 domain-containing protein [Mucilaginibacter sp.]HEK19339.1 DUF72 domain-containing protein [Bacteroidota bacterium]